MTKATRRTGLGRGLTALLNEQSEEPQHSSQEQPAQPSARAHRINTIDEVPLRLIDANPHQPREDFDPTELDRLAESVRRHGVIQPITVRATDEGRYQIIAGERRTRASLRAGLESIPAYIRDADDEGLVEMALIENIHREDLNPVEIAMSYQRLLEEVGLTQEELASKLGQNRSTITNYVRLLKLHPDVQRALREKQLSMGHARALLGLEDWEGQLKLMQAIVKDGWSVRKTEEQVRHWRERAAASEAAEEMPSRPRLPNLQGWQHHFTSLYQKPVRIKTRKDGGGEMVIPFENEQDLAQLAGRFAPEPPPHTGPAQEDSSES